MEQKNKIFGEEHVKKKLTQHNTGNLRDSATYLHPPEKTGRKFYYNRKITMFGLKAYSLSPSLMYTQVHSFTQKIKH